MVIVVWSESLMLISALAVYTSTLNTQSVVNEAGIHFKYHGRVFHVIWNG